MLDLFSVLAGLITGVIIGAVLAFSLRQRSDQKPLATPAAPAPPLPGPEPRPASQMELSLPDLDLQMRHSQKMEAMGRLAGGIAHDFNNLLTIITGYSDILLPLLETHEPAQEMVREIKAASERAAALTSQLLIFSRKQVLQPHVVDLNELVHNVRKMLRRLIGEDLEFDIATAPVPVPIKVDPSQIEQVLMNLAVNARDAMPQGGKLTITTRQRVLTAKDCRMTPDLAPGSYAQLAVSDNGVGMGAAVQNRIL